MCFPPAADLEFIPLLTAGFLAPCALRRGCNHLAGAVLLGRNSHRADSDRGESVPSGTATAGLSAPLPLINGLNNIVEY